MGKGFFMNPLISTEMVELIRTTGNALGDVPHRIKIMEALHLPYDRQAENVVIMGCQNLKLMPEIIRKFAGILTRGGLDYTFLSKEYCCGNYLYRPAIKVKDEAALTQ